MTETKSYIHTDSDGVMRAGTAGVALDGIVAAFEVGDSPESIQRQYPSLLLEEVYGAITYYLAHREEVAEYLKRQDAVWESWRSKLEKNPDPLIERLKAVREARTRQAS
jgi:hypothetical protein